MVQVVDLFGQVLDSAGQQTQGVPGSCSRPGRVQSFQCGAPLDQVRVGQAGQGLAQGGVGADQDAFGLVDGLGAGLDRRSLGELEQPQHLHRAVARLGRDGGAPGQHGAGGGFGVDGVGLAVASAGGLVRLVDLRDLDPLGVQVAGQGRSVGAGALDAGTSHHSGRACPGEELTVSLRGRREAPAVQGGTEHGDDSRGVNVLVGVHAEQNLLSGVGRDVTRGSGLRKKPYLNRT